MAGVLIGLRDLYVAEIDETAGTFETPYRIAKAIEATVTPNVSNAVLYADDEAAETATSEAETEIGLTVDALSNAIYAKLLGKHVNADGVVEDSSGDIPPKVALLFRSLKSNGKYRYYAFYNGSFQVPEESFATKGESVEYNTPSITGVFIHSQTIKNAKGEGIKRVFVDEDDADVDASIIENWFTEVYQPSAVPTP